jgi:hypothetical protein
MNVYRVIVTSGHGLSSVETTYLVEASRISTAVARGVRGQKDATRASVSARLMQRNCTLAEYYDREGLGQMPKG